MRIDCEKCGAAYAIEDRLVPPKGVRAQCPKCRNIQLVKKPEAPAAPVVESSNPKSMPQPARPIVTPQSDVPAQLAAAQKATKVPVGKMQTLPPVKLAPAAAEPPTAPERPALSKPEPPTTPVMATERPTTETYVCASCGKLLSDAFDRALGTCDSCREKEGKPPPTPTTAETPMGTPISGRNRMAPFSAARRMAEPKRWPLIVGGVGVLLLIAVAVVVLVKPFEPPKPIDKPVPAAVMTVLPRWKLSFMGLSGRSEEHLKEAEASLMLDTPGGYLDAEESFQKALLMNPDSDAAIIGYARALALGRGTTLDEETFQEALALIEAARSRSGEAPSTLIAEASLRLTRGQPEQVLMARALAERTLSSEDKLAQAEAHLILGRTFVATSLALALQHFDSAVQLAPQLSRVQLFRAIAYEESGDIQKALSALRERLQAAPDNPGALEALSRLYQESGDTDAAKDVYQRVLEQRPGDFRATLMLAVLKYQSESKPSEAVKALSAMAKDPDRYDERDRLELLTHLAAAQRAAGDLEGALGSAKKALEGSKDDPGAHLQSLLVLLDQDNAAEASTHLSFVDGHLGDAALERMIAARVRFSEGKLEPAASLFKEAAKLDARRSDAVMMAGVALAAANKREQALTALAPLEAADPLRTAPRAVVSRFYLAANDLLKPSGTHVFKLARNEEDVTPRVYQGLIHWHRGEFSEAGRHFRDVVEQDTRNVTAQAYLALIEERRGDFVKAKAYAERAVSANKRSAIAQYALGVALQGLGDREGASRAFGQAEVSAPGLIAAALRIAQLDAAAGRKDRARERLSRALSKDATYLPAKQILYALSIGGGTP